MNPSRVTLIILTVLCCGGLPGCGRGAGQEAQVQLSGNVSYENKPVPAGRIELLPDTSKGISGPAGYAEIVNGRYSTSVKGKGKGITPGPHIAVISGYSSLPKQQTLSDEEAAAQTDRSNILFRDFRVHIDVRESSNKQDFQVPARK